MLIENVFPLTNYFISYYLITNEYEYKAIMEEFAADGVPVIEMSTVTDEGIARVKEEVCFRLLFLFFIILFS